MGKSGQVYILQSIGKPSVIKIGRSEDRLDRRIDEVNQRPPYARHGPWVFYDSIDVLDCARVEKLIQSELSHHRKSFGDGATELFRIGAGEAAKLLDGIRKELRPSYQPTLDLLKKIDARIYLDRLLSAALLFDFPELQGAWAISTWAPGKVRKGSSGKRAFGINVGSHEVAQSWILNEPDKVHYHSLVMDNLVSRHGDVRKFLKSHEGTVRRCPYKGAEHAVHVKFFADFATATKFLAFSGVKRAIAAYWIPRLMALRDRKAKSAYAKFHSAELFRELRKIREAERYPLLLDAARKTRRKPPSRKADTRRRVA